MEHLAAAVERTAERLGVTPEQVGEVLDVYLDEASKALQAKRDTERRREQCRDCR